MAGNSKSAFAAAVGEALKSDARPQSTFEDTKEARGIALLLSKGTPLTQLVDEGTQVRCTVIDGEVRSRGVTVTIDGQDYIVSASKITRPTI